MRWHGAGGILIIFVNRTWIGIDVYWKGNMKIIIYLWHSLFLRNIITHAMRTAMREAMLHFNWKHLNIISGLNSRCAFVCVPTIRSNNVAELTSKRENFRIYFIHYNAPECFTQCFVDLYMLREVKFILFTGFCCNFLLYLWKKQTPVDYL